jgi:hypothetical protein
MRFAAKIIFALVLVWAAPAAFAQVSGDIVGPDDKVAVEGGCADALNPDDCMFGDSGWNNITQCTRAACPACAFDETGTKSICYYLTGNSGYCSCTGRSSVGRDAHGNTFPSCQTSGSCLNHR